MGKVSGRHAVLAAAASVGLGLAFAAVAADLPTTKPAPLVRGQQIWRAQCAACHGLTGAGDGAAAASLVGPVPDLSQGLGSLKPATAVRSVLRGKGLMPAYNVSLEKEEAEAVVKFLGTFPGGAERMLADIAGEQAEEVEPVQADGDDVEGDAQ